MRFISIFTHEPTDRSPTEAEMATIGKLIEESMKAGWLIATEGVHFGTTGVRVHKSAGGKVTVTSDSRPRVWSDIHVYWTFDGRSRMVKRVGLSIPRRGVTPPRLVIWPERR